MMRALVLLAACSSSDGAPAIFPADYAASYQEVRDCRRSLEHAATVRVLASPDAFAAYDGRTEAFPVGAIVLKEQYADDDIACAKPIVRYTVMQKLAAQAAPDMLDWAWQQVDADFVEEPSDLAQCVSCHKICGKAPMGYDGTCAEP
jgi:cytochrome P460